MSLTESVVRLCLGYIPNRKKLEIPKICFDFGTEFTGSTCERVSETMQVNVRSQLGQTVVNCGQRFPLSLRDPDGKAVNSISKLLVASSKNKGEILTASSAQAPGVVVVAAEWPLEHTYRLVSLLAHESMHQALFLREGENSPVREDSLGFSPWKKSTRPGRLVWHAYWTFTCQFVMLGEWLTEDSSLLKTDAALLDFLADMDARISLCLDSLELSNVVHRDELMVCKEAQKIRKRISDKLSTKPRYGKLVKTNSDVAFREFEAWASDLMSSAGKQISS